MLKILENFTKGNSRKSQVSHKNYKQRIYLSIYNSPSKVEILRDMIANQHIVISCYIQ